MVLTVTNLASSLARVLEILHQFCDVSYYKLNVNKTCILPINISKSRIARLKERFPFQWMVNSHTYLGVKIVFPSSKTYDNNFTTLLETIKAGKLQLLNYRGWVG